MRYNGVASLGLCVAPLEQQGFRFEDQMPTDLPSPKPGSVHWLVPRFIGRLRLSLALALLWCAKRFAWVAIKLRNGAYAVEPELKPKGGRP